MNIVFKQHMKVFLKEYMRIEDRHMSKFDQCKDYEDLMDFLGDHGERIADTLCIELDEDCDECWHKDHRIDELQEEIDSAPAQFKTMDEERKFEAFMENHHKYNAQEMSDLLT